MPKFLLVLAALWVSLGLASAQAAPLQLDDPVLPLAPKQQRTDAERDVVEARSLFATGRMLEQRGDLKGALRRYQRAYRLDPRATPILQEVVAVALGLDRHAEAIRYALKFAELDARDATLLRRLAMIQNEQGNVKQAIKLYEKVLELQAGQKPSAGRVALQLELGRLHYLSKNFAQAARMLDEIRDALEKPDTAGLDAGTAKTLQGEGGLTYELLAEVYLAVDRVDDAAAAYKKLDSLAPQPAVAAYHSARVLAKKKDFAAAREQLQKYLDAGETTKGLAPLELLAQVLKDQDKPDELLPLLEAARKQHPKNVPIGYFLALRYQAADKHPEAIAVLKELLEKRFTVEGFQALLTSYAETKQYEELSALIGKAAVTFKFALATAWGEPGKKLLADSAAVQTLLKPALEKLDKDGASLETDVARGLGILALEAKDFAAAERLFNRVFKPGDEAKVDDAAEYLRAWGVQLLLAERYDQASAIFRRGVAAKLVSDNELDFQFFLASSLEMAGKTEEALAAAATAAAAHPKSVRVQTRLPWILYHAKQYDEAYEKYTALLKKFGDDYSADETRDALREARLVLSNLCVLRDKLSEAEEWLEQVLDEFPDDVGASNDLGYLWADQNKNLARAHRMLEYAVDAEPDNLAYRDSLGWVLYRLGRYEEAEKELLRAIPEKADGKDKEPDGTILDHLGDVYLKLGNTAKAREYWTKAMAAMKEKSDGPKREAVRKKLEEHD